MNTPGNAEKKSSPGLRLDQVREKCRRDSDYIITLLVTNELSLWLTWLLLRTVITPNQITFGSIGSGLLAGVCYANGLFVQGSVLLFVSHVLDCTDGNLARAAGGGSSAGKWLDMVGDRIVEVGILLGAFQFFRVSGAHGFWAGLAVVEALLVVIYYYAVDVALLLKLSKPAQHILPWTFKGVRVKWGLFEPFLYGFIVLAPLGLLKIQVLLVSLCTLAALVFQFARHLRPQPEA